MKDVLVSSLRGSVVILLLTFVCVIALRFYKAVVPEQVERNTSNITQTSYAQERAKWAAQKVSVYEVRSSDPKVSVKVRVDRNTDDIFLLEATVQGRPQSAEGPSTPLAGVRAEVYGVYTVDAVYDTIAHALVSLSDRTPSEDSPGATAFHDFYVQFDPDRAYPTQFIEHLRTTLASREITWRTKTDDRELSGFAVVR